MTPEEMKAVDDAFDEIAIKLEEINAKFGLNITMTALATVVGGFCGSIDKLKPAAHALAEWQRVFTAVYCGVLKEKDEPKIPNVTLVYGKPMGEA